MALMRLAYASEATFEAQPLEKGVEPHVARILMASRRNNARTELVGGLYYGDNRFFQYLEGEEEFVRETFECIRQDSRHRNIRTLIEEPLGSRTFSNWSMKYVPLSSDVQAFLEKHQLSSFNPAGFSGEQCEEMIELIRRSSEDQKLVNHDDHSALAPAQALAPGVKYGLLAAGVLVVVALVAGALVF
ncbi:BLUF domain-containing protein [Marinobacter sp. VGCF2001]|uniref:BLUF domain-containing protein n=1 Tax=Marinobacter sp. VGCF2001 TaxID=3417189 RepID=UPI003CE96AE9